MSAVDADPTASSVPSVLECGRSMAEHEHREHEFRRNKSAEKIVQFQSIAELRKNIAEDVVTTGRSYSTFTSPFEVPQGASTYGDDNKYLKVPLVYCDQTASNRPLQSIENYIQKVCLPLYGNTHTNTSITGSQSTAFVAEARQIIAEETNAKITGKASQDVVLFTGNGATSAVELLIDCLGLSHASEESRPVVFVGPYEHHSNLIPWRETGCEIVMIPESAESNDVDFELLERLLAKPEYENRFKMGTFCAASNVTGKVSDVDRIAAILHQNGAMAFFDYATAAPYVKIDMNPPPSDRFPTSALTAKDAIFISPHKMLGGVGSPGVLVVKKKLVSQTNAPHRSGGGTVFYVTSKHHRFLGNRIERYEGGTPNVAAIMRAGLTFLTKRKTEREFRRLLADNANRTTAKVPQSVEDFDCAEYQRIATYLKEHAPNLVLLGDETSSRNLPIFSFLIRFQNRFLHFNYVCAILNDVFGIQSRGGCMCAGPLSQQLLGLTMKDTDGLERPTDVNREIEEALIKYKESAELLRPGYTRLSIPFKGVRQEEVDFILRALVWTAQHAWALLCQYRCNHRTGEWRHSSRQGKPLGREERKWLSHFDFGPELVHEANDYFDYQTVLDATLANADLLLAAARKDHQSINQALKLSNTDTMLGQNDEDKLEKLRWFAYPKDCASLLKSMKWQHDSFSGPLAGALNPLTKPKQELVTRKRERQSNTMQSADALSDLVRPVGKKVKSDIDQKVEVMADGTDTEHQKKAITAKKASRDSFAWGQGKVTAVSETAVSDVAPGLEVERPVQQSKKVSKFKHTRPPPKMMRLITQAIMQWEMIQEGDKLLLGLSGGKDSMSLLHALLEFRRKSPVKFDLEVCTIDPLTPSFDPSPLIPYVESLGLKYHYVRDDIVSRAGSSGKKGKEVSSLCAFCARMKRGNLYTCARKNGCNKLVLAQHLDDCAESFFMSVMHNGFLRTMKANYSINAGDLAVIRPLLYCRESLMAEFAKANQFPVINENCPACFEEPKERARIKKLLSRQEMLYPNFYDNIRRSLLPLMHDDTTAILRCYTEEVVARSRKNGSKETAHTTYNSQRNETENNIARAIGEISDDELVKELARRKADSYRLSGSMKRNDDDAADVPDPTGQVCSLNGGNGSIPCRELME